MKTILTFILSLMAATLMAQTPQYFKYQAVARNNSGEILANSNLVLRVSILKGNATGTAQYVETHTVTTNDFGLINIEIGDGSVQSGSFGSITWADDNHFVKLEIDLSGGGSSFEWLGTSQLLSVPYSLVAGEVVDDAVTESSILNEAGLVYGNYSGYGKYTDASTTWEIVDQLTIDCPSKGYVVCVASGYVDYDNDAFTASTNIGWDNSSDAGAPSSYIWATMPNPDDNAHLPYSSTYVFTVNQAGSFTYYLKAKVGSGDGTDIDVYVNNANLMFFPTAY